MVPTFVPVVAPTGGDPAPVAAGLDGVAALLVWASAEIVKTTAMARRSRKNLLVIGSVKLLGTFLRNTPRRNMPSDACLTEQSSGNELRFSLSESLLQSTPGRT